MASTRAAGWLVNKIHRVIAPGTALSETIAVPHVLPLARFYSGISLAAA